MLCAVGADRRDTVRGDGAGCGKGRGRLIGCCVPWVRTGGTRYAGTARDTVWAGTAERAPPATGADRRDAMRRDGAGCGKSRG